MSDSRAMSPELMRLLASAEALAAFAALHRAEAEGLAVPAAVQEQLERAVAAVGLPRELAPPARTAAIGAIQAILQQAVDLIATPDRAPGWAQLSPTLLQQQGRASEMIPGLLAGAAADHAPLAEVLRRAAPRFLDVGVGVGWLAIAAARTWPGMRILGLDIHPPALELARRNIEAAALGGRIAVELADVRTFSTAEPFDLVWLPGPFLSEAVLREALAVCRTALTPGGVVVVGLYAGVGDPLSEALADLRAARSGGAVWTTASLSAELAGAGYVSVRELHRTWSAPMRFFAGSAP